MSSHPLRRHRAPHPISPLLLALFALPAPHAQAQETQAARELGAIVVAASRSETRVEDMPRHTTIITQEEIARSPAQSLDQLLRNVPGLNFTGVPVVQSDPTGHQTRMRGIGNAKVLMLLDGVPIHDPFYLTTQFFKVPLSTIERIEVVRGGNSSLWGNMAVAGVINVVSKRVKDDSGEASASLGSRGTVGGSVAKNFAFGPAFGLSVALDDLQWQGYQVTPAEHLWRFPQKAATDARNTNVQITAFLRPSSNLEGYLRLGYHVQDQDISYVFGNNLQKNPDGSASLSWKIDDRSSLSGTAWAQYVKFEKYNGSSCYFNAAAAPANRCPSSTAVTPAQVSDNVLQYYTQYGSQRYHEAGGSLIHAQTMAGAWRDLQFGADVRRLSANDVEFFYGAPTVQSAQQGNLNSTTVGRARQTFTGLFAQTRVVPADPLEITLSARYDTWENADRENTRTRPAGATTGGTYPDSTKSAINPSVALRYELTDASSLRAAAYKSFRAPGFNNTTRTFGANTPTIANPDLGPENLKGIEIGTDYASGPLSGSATFYRYDIRNMIATFRVNSFATAPEVVRTICSNGGANLTNCGGSANYYTNDQDGRSQGLELVGAWRVSRSLSISGTYTYTESHLTRRGAVVTDPLNVQLTGIPKHTGTLGVTWQGADKLAALVEMRYIGAMNIDTTTVANTAFEQGSITVFNASLRYALTRETEVVASAVNLFDREYSENAYTFNQPFNRTLSMPRTATLTLKTRF